jgi:hypothetical protein
MEPAAGTAIVLMNNQEAVMSDHWRHSTEGIDSMRGTGEDAASYAAGWTVSGLATLATILAVWVFAI